MIQGERFNGFTHLAGALLAVVALVALVGKASLRGDAVAVASVATFGVTLVLLYTASTVYHSSWGRLRAVLVKVDHVAIYLLIAGTTTPFGLVTLRDGWGLWLFGVSWGLALVGIVQELLWARGARWSSLALYLVMGWLVVGVAGPLHEALGTAGLGWLIAGGLAYTGGVAFYLLDEKVKHFHGVWHLCVLGGSACHVAAVWLYVV